MTYEINTTINDEQISVIDVVIMDGEVEVLRGQAKVMITSDNLADENGNTIHESIEAAARAYAENVFLVDLRNNCRCLRGLVLPIDSQG